MILLHWIVLGFEWIGVRFTKLAVFLRGKILIGAILPVVAVGIAALALVSLSIYGIGSVVSNLISPSVPARVDSSAYVKLTDELAQAQEDKRTLEENNDAAENLIDKLRDRPTWEAYNTLKKKFPNVVQVSEGSGKVNLHDVAIRKDTTFEGDWVVAYLDSTHTKLDCWFNFMLHSVDVTLQNDNGEERSVYSVYLQSLKDTNNIFYLGDFVKKIGRVPIVPEDLSRMWIESAISLGIYFGKATSGGISYTPFMISSQGDEQKNVWLRYPSIGLSSNFKNSTVLSAGVDLNIAHFIGRPLVDLSISPMAGFDIKAGGFALLIAVKTRL